MADRRAAERRGRRGELAAALALMLKGYAILERRLRTPLGEIDLVARKGALIAFIEVKARPNAGLCIDAVTPRAWGRISAAADLWMSRRAQLSDFDRRFDIVAITPRAWPIHMRDAWRP